MVKKSEVRFTNYEFDTNGIDFLIKAGGNLIQKQAEVRQISRISRRKHYR
jgi:hypothetical protein